ncbi:MAG: glycosyltransferase family 9 protein [Planctomycetota bacterium]
MERMELARPPRRILCVATPGFGDALLATPLIRSLKRAWPAASIDLLVHRGREAMLEGNPDLHRALPVRKRPGPFALLAMLARLTGRYDLALCAMPSDRNMFTMRLAARRLVVSLYGSPSRSPTKRRVATLAFQKDMQANTVGQMLAFADVLGIPRCFEVVPPTPAVPPTEVPDQPFAVVHATTRREAKRWSEDGWRAVGAALQRAGLQPVVTAGPDDDRGYLDRVQTWLGAATLDLAGRLSIAEVGALSSKAALFFGVDTATSHLAAAVGAPTVTLFGSGNSLVWSPWPRGYDRDFVPFSGRPGVERVGNVTVVQAGADGLDSLPPEPVLEAIQATLASKPS